MKVLGTSQDGNPIIELDAQDRKDLLAVGALVSRMPLICDAEAREIERELQTPSAPATTAPRPAQRPSGGAPKAKPAATVRLCEICEKPIPATASLLAKCCGTACIREKARRAYEASKGKPAAKKPATPAPAPAPDRLCDVCEKPLGPGYHKLATTHDGECYKTKRAADARRNWHKKHPGRKHLVEPDPAPQAAPAVPPKIDKAERLRLISEAADRVDPKGAADRLANQIHREEENG